jgi:hypothetical protein
MIEEITLAALSPCTLPYSLLWSSALIKKWPHESGAAI